MNDYLFEFNLETGKVENDTVPRYAVRYYSTENGILVEIGDGFRHTLRLNAKHWNRLLKIIKNDELDEDGINAITNGLMWKGLPEEYEETFISAIKAGVIKEIK